MIPVSEPILGELEEKYVLECLRTNWISSEGPFVLRFENACAKYCNVKHGIAVSSGTAALQVALRSLPIQQGDEIIVPAFTIISCVIAIIEAGAIPVLVDCTKDTWTMDPEEIEKKITSKTKAIMVVHIYGHPVDMDPIQKLADQYNLITIEDAAEAHGAEYKGKKCGGLADISILSFYANKLITTGEGGMVLTSKTEYAEKARSLSNMCFRSERRFFHTEVGHNYRLTNIQAAIGLAQLSRLDQFVEQKQKMAQHYQKALKGLPLHLPVQKEWAKNNYWMYAVVLKKKIKKDATYFIQKMGECGIQTRPFFLGMHEQPVWLERGLFQSESYPVCEYIAQKGFYLPSGQALTDEQIDITVTALKKIFNAL